MNTPLKIGILGASGRMGLMLIKAVSEDENCTLIGALEREGSKAIGQDAGMLAGLQPLGIAVSDDPLPLFTSAQAVIDFTTPQGTLTYASLAAQARIVHVIGTTGLSEDDFRKLDAAAYHATIIQSGNMSLGINLLAGLVRQAARALSTDFDIEIVEMHHRHKVDAPSGTALLLGDAAAQGRSVALKDVSVRVREGHTGARHAGDIGFATLRGGSVIGDHSVILAGTGERIELTHRAEDRMIFARGAVKAALWGRDKKPGRYGMADVLGLDPF
jgi:4-hydroxy-tetrahydrodipicolinate reductase